jgi:hypothetical protein
VTVGFEIEHACFTGPEEAQAVKNVGRLAQDDILGRQQREREPSWIGGPNLRQLRVDLTQQSCEDKLHAGTRVVRTAMLNQARPLSKQLRRGSRGFSPTIELTDVATAVCAKRQRASPCRK